MPKSVPITAIQKPVAPPAPVVAKAVVPVPPPPPAPVKAATPTQPPAASDDAHQSPWLPAIHVMPKDVAQLKDGSHITPFGSLKKAI